jgi:predicted N-acetyltransferase YhbS
MKIVRATTEDHTALTAITKRSKAFWNYEQQQLEEWAELLTITPDYILSHETYKLILEEEIIGYYSVVKIDLQTIKIDNLFVLPEFIGQGLGRKLMDDILEKAALKKYGFIILDSDPNAEAFYRRFGFVKIGQIETSVKDRFLPIMKKTL